MKAIKIIGCLGLFLFIGCTAVTTSEEPIDSNSPDAIEAQPEETPMNESPEADPTATDDGSKQLSEPVTVNLGDVTPQPIDDTPVVQPAPGNPGLKDEPVSLAMADLSSRLNVSIDEIELVSLKEVTWRDGSVGCPEADMAYIQVLTAGQQLILRVDGQDFYYHSGKQSVFNYCGDPQPPIENMGISPNQPPPPGQDD